MESIIWRAVDPVPGDHRRAHAVAVEDDEVGVGAGESRPRRSSAPSSQAGAAVKDVSASSKETPHSAAARRPASGSRSSTGASEPPARRTPASSSCR